MSNNEYIKKAEEELEYLTGDEETRRLAYLREKAIRDERAAMTKARREGHAAGEKKKQKEIVRKMLAENIDINLIIKITGLSKEEIENL